MTRVLVAIAVAVIAFSTIVVAIKAEEPPSSAVEPQRSNQDTDVEAPVVAGTLDSWPAPKEPFDETRITPVESAGAPMFP